MLHNSMVYNATIAGDSDMLEQNAERNEGATTAEKQNIRPTNATMRQSAWDAAKATQRGTENAKNGKRWAHNWNNSEQPHSLTSLNDRHAWRGTKHRYTTMQSTQEPTTNT